MSNLRERLRRIQEQKYSEQIQITVNKEQRTDNNEYKTNNIEKINKNKEHRTKNDAHDLSCLINDGWEVCGYKVLKREVNVQSPFNSMNELPSALPVVIPDLDRLRCKVSCAKDIPLLEDFVFFDLETTGLSGGSGTVAFLAAFGQVHSSVLRGKLSRMMRITQYLLLDYPGQNDFLENVLTCFKNEKSVIVTYNGKCFDSQILKSMCIMNRINPPEYSHVDLLHPSRRLWKRIIQNCRQSSVETKIIGLDRIGDISGEFAPDIWFDFIKTGNTERLIQICDHNKKDIYGLAAIFSAMILIAQDPFNDLLLFDIELLAMYWRKYIRKNNIKNKNVKLEMIGNELLRYAALMKYPRAVYYCGYDQMRNKNYAESLKFINLGLEIFEKDGKLREKLLRRKERIENYLIKK